MTLEEACRLSIVRKEREGEGYHLPFSKGGYMSELHRRWMAHRMHVYYGIEPEEPPDHLERPFLTKDEERIFAVLMEDCQNETEVLKHLLCRAEMENPPLQQLPRTHALTLRSIRQLRGAP